MAHCSNNNVEEESTSDDDDDGSPIRQFKNLKSDLDRVNFAYVMDFDKYPNLLMDRDEKTDGFATIYLEHSDELLFQGKIEESIKYLTCALANAKSNEITAIAYSKRAKVLYEMKLFKECATDIRRSLVYDKEIEIKVELMQLLEDAENKSETFVEEYCDDPPKITDHLINPSIECAMDSVDISTNSRFGRHVVATRDIHFGEILTIEKPYVGMVKNFDFFHCQNCLKLCYNLIPCICTLALYCSNDCRFDAFKKYHKYECQISGLLKWNHRYMLDKSVFMAVKATFLAMNEESNNVDNNNCYKSNRFHEIYNLITHSDQKPIQELIAMAKFAAKTYHFVKKYTTFFRDLAKTHPENNENFDDLFKTILMRLLQSFSVNSVKLFELVCSPLDGCKVSSFASGVYSFSSIFNHSCIPNSFRHFYGSTMVTRSLRRIKKGEQCFVSYGPKFDLHTTEERQIDLFKGYHFKCECSACYSADDFDGNVISKMPENFDYESFRSQVEGGNRQAAKEILPRILQEIEKIPNEHSLDNYQDLQELGRFCYDLLGNKRRDFTQ